MQKRLFLFILSLTCNLLLLTSAQGQVLKGSVSDKLSGQFLWDAEVSILSSPFSTVTNQRGEFWIEPITEEWVRVEVIRHGYERKEFDLKVSPYDTTVVQLPLLPAVATLNEGVVITAHRYPREALRTAVSITRVGREIFRQYNPRTVPEALQGMAGLWLEESSPASAGLYMRGLTGNRTLLMVDGIRLNQSSFGPTPSPFLGTIDPYNVEQIEAIRGGASTQYGSDAMGGVTQVFTRSPGFSGQGLQIHGGGAIRYLGRNMERSAHGEFQIHSPRLAFHAGMTLRNFDNRHIGRQNGSLPGTDFRERAGDMKARFRLNDKQSLTLAYQFLRQDEVEDYAALTYGGFTHYQIQPRQRELAYLRYRAHTDQPWLKEIIVTTSFQRLQQQVERETRDATFFERERNAMDTWGASLEIHSQPNLYWNAVSGLEYYFDLQQSEGTRYFGDGTNPLAYPTYIPDGSSLAQLGVYTLHTVDLLKLRISFGGRGSGFQMQVPDPDFGTQNLQTRIASGNIGAQYPLHPNVYLTSTLQTGFRSPNLYDLGALGAFDQGIVTPTDSLGPERSLTSQFGIKAKTAYFSGSIVVYRTRLTDLIETKPGFFQGANVYDGQAVYQLQNEGRARIQGIEAELEVPLSRTFVVYGNVVYTRGQLLSQDEAFSRIPPLNSRMGLHFRSRHGIWSRVEWLHADAQTRLSPADQLNPAIPVGGSSQWDVFNLYLGYDFQWGYATVGVRNALDSPYRMLGSSLDQAGRAVVLSLQVGF